MLIVGSVGSVVVDIGVVIFCLFAGIGALQLAWEISPGEQRRTLQRGDLAGASPVWMVVALRLLYTVVGLAFLAPIVLAIVGVIPWN